jgi:flagellar hook-associated protein 3 FlgL
MRIATSTIYDQQTTSIDNLSSQYQNIGQQLSSGKSLNVPSDDPSIVSQDLTLNATIASENADASNATSAQNQLTFTDTALNSLTTVLQTARNLAVEGATDIIPNGTQRPLIGKQVDGLLQQAIGLANSQYGDTYVFAGTGPRTSAPVTAVGDPATGITFSGNLNNQTEVINGQTVQTGTTLQQGFNYNSTNGSPDVFTLLATLRDTLDNEPAAVQSGASVNVTGDTIYGSTAATQTTLDAIAGIAPPGAPKTTTALTPDSNGNYNISISGTSPTGVPVTANLTFAGNTPLDATAAQFAPNGGVIQQINLAAVGANGTGVYAAWNQQTQRIELQSGAPVGQTPSKSPSFELSDAASAGATTQSNVLEAFQLPNTGSVTENLSTQLGNIDTVINAVLAGRAQVGQQIQNLAATTSQLQGQSTDNTVTKSGYEDTNVAQATSQFSLVQTALQAAYATTTRLESKSLLDFLTTS